MAAAVGSQQPVFTQIVGEVFVEKYYTILHSSPELAHKFYQDKSTIQRFEEDGSMSVTTTCQAIKEKIVSLNYGDLRTEIKSVNSVESFPGEVNVLVTGHLVRHDHVVKSFSQHFVLAPQDNGYFVLSDLLRCVDIVNGNPTLGSEVVVCPTTTPAIADEVYSASEDGNSLFFGGEEVPDSDSVDELRDDKEVVVKSSAKHDQISKKSYASVVRSDVHL
ncbi:nuclear transport factor 2 family protein [Striga asiatica]|uniref:Nuclear transport factor 2 family protein n=1 Tax=Striga asiatica TaxID=4170 RepID=A0A5A7PVW7_STRAF|nr:nuclear transport factor 2 family protein [Striga asiatica]